MLILIIFAFIAGIFTALSPCVLPILPVLLSASTQTGRWRPFGIIVGLIVSFTFFTLALTAIVHATGLSANAFRYVAIAIITFFGLVMIFPRLSNWFASVTSPIANIGHNVQNLGSGSGFGGGILFGIALGLLWTPCAGPILAAISALVATQSINLTTVLITLAYSLGAAIPMFLIAVGGSKVIQSSKYLSKHSEGIRQFFGALMLFSALMIAFHWDMWLQLQVSRVVPTVLIEDNSLVKNELEKLHQPDVSSTLKSGKTPELKGITNWINSPPLSLMQLQGKVVLIDFWTYSCINCLRTLPYIKKWYEEYKDKGFVVIGVHTPEFEFEKDPQNVAEAVFRLGVQYPVAQDNNYKTWEAFHNHYWPAHYLIDKEGKVSNIHYGEGKYVETENEIRELLGLAPLKMQESQKIVRPISPETYLGTLRGIPYAEQVSLQGKWKAEPEYIISEEDGSELNYNFLATQVYLVLGGTSKKPIEVYLDGKKVKEFTMDGDRKYDIVTAPYGRHQLSLKIPKGIKAYAFTFGDE